MNIMNMRMLDRFATAAVVVAIMMIPVVSGCGSDSAPGQDIVDVVAEDECSDAADVIDVALDDGDANQRPDGDGEDATTDEGIDAIDPDTIGNPDYPQDPSAIELHGACPLESRLGGFKVEMNEDSSYTAIDGQVNNAVTPSLVSEVFTTDGDCKLLKRRRLVCNPACTSAQTCGFDETCIDAPVGQDMGMAVFRGLAKGVAISPIQPGNKYFYTRLPHPGFQSGRVLQVATSGGFLPAVEMYGVGVDGIVVDSEKLVLTQGQPLQLSWVVPTATADVTGSRVYFEINIDQHGATPLNLVCDLPDTGSATISQTLLDAFIGAGVTGYPSAKLVRRTVDSSTSEEGCIDFQVTSVRQVKVEVTGHIPCARDTDCPEGMNCNTEIQQCY